jgi:hypothetical protein
MLAGTLQVPNNGHHGGGYPHQHVSNNGLNGAISDDVFISYIYKS